MIGIKFGKYRVEKWIGGGAFADVFLVYDTIVQKRFAIKVSRQRQKEMDMLLHEARLLASLEHPNIVRFYNAEIIDGRLILVVEYVEGVSLRKLIEDEAPFELHRAVGIFFQMLDALSYAHSRGVLHRDIKPENILLTDRGVVKITDFGLGTLFSGESLSLSVAGTPLYMPPEAWKGKYSRETDIWAAAAVFYEMLAGRPPFFDESLDGLRSKIARSRLRRIPNLRHEIMDVIRKALNARPEKRFSTASEFKKALMLVFQSPEIPIASPVGVKKRESPVLKGLTGEQKDAVTTDAMAVLVIGSAGTGKTTTLAHRIAYLIREKKVPADRVIAVTFTGKAAVELKNRVVHMIGEGLTRQLWTGTFHLLGQRIIAYGANRLGLPEDFTVIGRDESLRIASKLIGELNYNRLKGLMREISLAKSRLISPEVYKEKAKGRWQSIVAKLYEKYEAYKMEHGLIDYDDMISLAVKLLSSHRDIKDMFLDRFDHIVVDEFQDINHAQYELIKALSIDVGGQQRTAIFATGDDDQSIFGFRGASSQYMTRLKVDYPHLVEFKLTHNFRLPAEIISLAENLIAHNARRLTKIVVPHYQRSVDKPVLFYAASDETDEALYVATRIMEEHERGIEFDDMAVIMRMNSYSRAFEEIFAGKGIPFNIVGGGGFWDRQEVREAVEVVKLLVGEASGKVLRGALSRFLGFSRSESAAALKYFDRTGKPTFSSKLSEPNLNLLKKLWDMIVDRRSELDVVSPADFLRDVFSLTGYLDRLENASGRSKELEHRYITELLDIAESFGPGGVKQFISHVAVARELSLQTLSTGGVQLMSIHSAKGLEFSVVFLVGMAEGIFPSNRSIADPVQLEEERRLCFVGITRALDRLYITYPKNRFRRYQEPSRFIYEMYSKEM